MRKLIEDFITKAECDQLIGLGKSYERAPSKMARDYFNENFKKTSDILWHGELATWITAIDAKIKGQIEDLGYEVEHDKFGNFYEYVEGDFYRPHSDAYRIDVRDPDNAMAYRQQWRDVSAVVFLNDDYEGGEFAFLHDGESYKPKAGSLILFTSDWRNDHGVKTVTKGNRYTIANWFKTTPELCVDVEPITKEAALKYRTFMDQPW